MPSAHYDMPWKMAIAHAFRPFMAFFFPELCARIDWTKRPRFRDKELVGLGFGARATGIVADKLVEVCLRDRSVQWVLVHIEAQAQRDPALARRVLDYNYRIFSEHRQPVISLVLLADNDPNWHPRSFHNALPDTVMGISFSTAKLLDYADQTDALLASHNPFAWITLAHLRTQRARGDPAALYAAKWQLTKLLYEHGWSRRRIIMLFKVINWMMTLPEPYQQRYWRAVVKLEKERKMEWISPLEQSFMEKGWQKGLKKGLRQGLEQGRTQGMQRGMQRGLEQGLEQGLELGRKEGALTLLERQLIRRFGELPRTARSKLASASLAQLHVWSDALSEAKSLQQLLKETQ